jgi:hypothetical protein
MLTDAGLAVHRLLQHATQLCAAPIAGLGRLRDDEHTGHIQWPMRSKPPSVPGSYITKTSSISAQPILAS